MNHPIKSPRKLIEVALPLDAINLACSKEKTVRHGHPANLHRWWARRPLAAARAVLFSQLVNDPGYQQGGGFKYGMNKRDAAKERKRLFQIIEELVLWENSTNVGVLERARIEIERSWREVCEINRNHPQASDIFNPDKLPCLCDPFAGGGAIPLEAQRLGLQASASDLNPVAVLINKAMIEIPAKFNGLPPVSLKRRQLEAKSDLGFGHHWPGTTALAEDVRYYGTRLCEKARKSLGHLYPNIEITAEMVAERRDLKPLLGKEYPIIAWLWARTVKSPNPAYRDVDVPLVSSFVLCNKSDKEAYVEPLTKNDCYEFKVKKGTPPETAKSGTKLSRGANFRCILSDVPIEPAYIKSEGIAKRMGARLMAIVAEGDRGRIYLSPTSEHERIAKSVEPTWRPELLLPNDPRNFWTLNYGLVAYADLFTSRQMHALTVMSDLIEEIRSEVLDDSLASGRPKEMVGLESNGDGALAYAESIACYLSLVLSKTADSNNSLCPWEPVAQCSRQLFGRQAIPMMWDYAEANILHDSSGGFATNLEVSIRSFTAFPAGPKRGYARQEDASQKTTTVPEIVSTDPPYYDNIAYADLSDFFYIWLRRSLKASMPQLFSTIAVPKKEELIASPYRNGSKDNAESFFLHGMTNAMHLLANSAHPAFPVTIYYAFKQSETKLEGTTSAGWETFLEAIIRAGFALYGTWPLRTEMTAALKNVTNSLASSIVLVCRRRPIDAQTISRREFLRELNAILPDALDEMTRGSEGEHSPVAPVDLSQAIIGPGMAVFSKYSAVLEADGSPMTVKTALQLINRFLAEDDFDADTQFCLRWFEQYGWQDGAFGEADVLARSKSTSVEGIKEAGVIRSGGSKVRLLKWAEYATDWDPRADPRTPIWGALHQLIRALKQGGESASGVLLAALGDKAEAVRQLAYRLYTMCERLGKAEDARAYNELITSWTGIESAAASSPKPTDGQLPGFET